MAATLTPDRASGDRSREGWSDTAPKRTVTRRVGLPSGRAAVGGLLMALAALGVFLAYDSATTGETEPVYVAARDLPAGTRVDQADLRLVDVDLQGNGLGTYRPGGPLVGQYTTVAIGSGEVIIDAAVTPADRWEPAVEITLTLPSDRAMGGAIRIDHRVDVYVSWSRDLTELVAAGAVVLDVTTSDGGSFRGGSQSITVRLALDDPAAVQPLVHAQAHGELTVVLSTQDGIPGTRFVPPSDDDRGGR